VSDAITEEVRALERLDLEGLRAEWRRRYGPPPKVRSPELVRLSLAWRIQSEALGGLDVVTRRRLRQSPGAPARSDHLGVGARITREWRGVIHEVDRVADGFRWNGTTYSSLSAVAKAISGVKRNGPQFFGLREAEPSK
jgi:hypothetical protein